MVGSYPRPSWFTQQLAGRDIWDAFKQRAHQEAFEDAVRTTLKDQELAGLDLLADGQMWFDDYVGGIGSFVWYWFERIPGFEPLKRQHPEVLARHTPDYEADRWLEWGASTVVGEVRRGPLHLADLWQIAQRNSERPVKMCVGAGPINLGFHVHYGYYRDQRELAYALAPIFNAELRELAAAGCRAIQLDDLGAWLPIISGNLADARWVVDVINRTVDGVDADISWHFCYGNSWGNPTPNVVFGRGQLPRPDGRALRRERDRVCARLRHPRHARRREPGRPPVRQARRARRDRRTHHLGRDAAHGGRADSSRAGRGARRTAQPDHRLRDEAPAALNALGILKALVSGARLVRSELAP